MSNLLCQCRNCHTFLGYSYMSEPLLDTRKLLIILGARCQVDWTIPLTGIMQQYLNTDLSVLVIPLGTKALSTFDPCVLNLNLINTAWSAFEHYTVIRDLRFSYVSRNCAIMYICGDTFHIITIGICTSSQSSKVLTPSLISC